MGSRRADGMFRLKSGTKYSAADFMKESRRLAKTSTNIDEQTRTTTNNFATRGLSRKCSMFTVNHFAVAIK
jgi:hypothetical protein